VVAEGGVGREVTGNEIIWCVPSRATMSSQKFILFPIKIKLMFRTFNYTELALKAFLYLNNANVSHRDIKI
jgi:hypothetical protein